MINEQLFAGKPSAFGGLSNEFELAKIIPDEFNKENPWSHVASMLFFKGGSIRHWKWRNPDKAIQNKQLNCFYSLLGSFGVRHEHKEGIAGWMLSEMLTEVPAYVESPEVKND